MGPAHLSSAKTSTRRGIRTEGDRETMAAMAGLFNRSLTAGQALTGGAAGPMAASPTATGSTGSTNGANSSGSSAATISANDFLTLLVTEMQNQDPTANTDPNQYIDQLVQVNSLEQLISINQNLTTALGSSNGSGTSSSSGQAQGVQGASGQTAASGLTGAEPVGTVAPAAAGPQRAGTAGGSASPGAGTARAISQFAQSEGALAAPGNLSVPESHASAHKVAHALDGHRHAAKIPGKPAGAQ